MSDRSETELIAELFEKNRQMMYKIAFGILHNEADAEDVVQNAFLWIINNLEKVYQVPDYERALYFSVIIKNAALNVINRQKRHPLKDIDEYVDIASEYSVEDRASDNIMVNEIEKALGELSDRDYSLMYLYVFKHKKYREIAEALNIPEKNIHSYIKRARKRLIKILKKRGIVDDI